MRANLPDKSFFVGKLVPGRPDVTVIEWIAKMPGAPTVDAGPGVDAGTDAGSPDAGDAGPDATADAAPAADASADALVEDPGDQ